METHAGDDASLKKIRLTALRLWYSAKEMGRALGRFTDVRFCLVVGGLASSVQEAELRSSPDVVVATPGRLIDLLRNAPTVSLDAVEILVLDEADRLLDLGFRDEVNAQL